MKKKNLLQTTILIIILCVMNQFANACNCHKVGYGCNGPNPQGCIINCSLYCSNFCIKHPNSCARISEAASAAKTFFIDVFPNPVSTSTTILFLLAQLEKISLKIFDMNGRLITTLANKVFEADEYEFVWSAADVNAGVYFLQFQSAENLQTEKLIVTK